MLKLYSNIKRLRKQHNMTQQELAEAVGYTSKSMIAQIENGKVDLPQSKIMEFASVFGVKPGELMGWDEDVDYVVNREDESKELYQKFASLPPDKQVSLLNYLEYLRSNS